VTAHYDVIIIGTGVGGGTLARHPLAFVIAITTRPHSAVCPTGRDGTQYGEENRA
jgi:hypothetical protein